MGTSWYCTRPFEGIRHSKIRSPEVLLSCILIRVGSQFYGYNNLHMFSLLISLFDRIGRFQEWFDGRFGWFFTNGMKEPRRSKVGSFRA